MHISPYIYALLSNLTFGIGAQIFTKFSRKISPVWMTVFKGSLACLFFFLSVMLMGGFHPIPLKYMATFILSGFIALGLGDILLLKAFADMGPGRTMMLFAFQPLIVGVFSYFLFGQAVNAAKFFSIIFFIICIFIFAFENFKKSGKWSFTSMLIAFCGMTVDAVGILITRYSFNGSNAAALEGNFYRALGAVLSFILVCGVFKINFFAKFKILTKKEIALSSLGVFMGCYLCLLFYLAAIKTGHLATLSSIAITGVIFAGLFECLFERKLPSKYLMTAFFFFCAGMYILLRY
ncbi:protein of unknown function DUF6 transmembrane [Elusimicrobium minutum Pei191]|uniref:EamA domain-containing protein n=1 Tax=Elusimicrobium minutum (strain Pei191) TaxID=445932 RepID=B2KBE3_ELUMP|nr:DMT family transporter [Elusimicrobium minutum]ACC97965.1 protein of unknown function DUF6 transmembrane [Elusimicrobium minutum Pei191]